MKTIRTIHPFVGFWDTRQGGRPENQDSCGFIDTPHGLMAIVCDGMGGGPAGRNASVLAVKIIAEYVCRDNKSENPEDILRNAIIQAHQVIIAEGNSHPELRGMGSTVVAVLFHQKAAIVAHVGDSRAYQFRGNHMVFRTQDHSMVADLVRKKELTEEQARLSSQTNLITKALGGKAECHPDINLLPYEKGDRFLLCTDGIWGALTEKELIKRASQTPSLAGAVDGIVLYVDEIGRQNGNNHDNLTMALFEAKKDSTIKVKMNRKAKNIIRALTALCVVSLIIIGALVIKLAQPSPESKMLKQSELRIAEQSEEINRLKQEVKNLQGDVTKYSQKAADAKMEVAAEKQKAAEKLIKEEAEKKAKESQQAALKKKEEHDKIQAEIKSVISSLDLAAKRKGKERKNYVEKASSLLDILAQKDTKNKNVYLSVRAKLTNSVTMSNSDKAIGHFKMLINELNNIK